MRWRRKARDLLPPRGGCLATRGRVDDLQDPTEQDPATSHHTPLSRCGDVVDGRAQTHAQGAPPGTRLMDAFKTLWLEPPSAAGARAGTPFDPTSSRTIALPRMGKTWTASLGQPASVNEVHRGEQMHPPSLLQTRNGDAAYPRARPPSLALLKSCSPS